MRWRPLLCLYIFAFVLFWGCGASTDEKRAMAIYTALNHLSQGNCQAAIKVLEGVGRDPGSVQYVQTLASAYACRAGYSEITFFKTDISKISSIADEIIRSFATFTTAPMVSPTDADYVDLKAAIDVLLYAGGITSPSHSNRSQYFTTDELSEMNVQMLYMLVNLMGKYFYYYGNVDATGAKGAGAGTNICLVTYTDATAQGLIDANPTGSCANPYTGHPDMAGANQVKRMCEGIVMFNNTIDILSNTTLSGSQVGDLNNIATTLDTQIQNDCVTAGYGSVCTEKSQSQCEADYAADTASLEKYFAAVFEQLFI